MCIPRCARRLRRLLLRTTPGGWPGVAVLVRTLVPVGVLCLVGTAAGAVRLTNDVRGPRGYFGFFARNWSCRRCARYQINCLLPGRGSLPELVGVVGSTRR
ncbi:hypothetical protein [Crucivirus-419]|nr:hypothetical protein [Crucivirus-419]